MPAATKPALKSKALAKSGNTALSKRAGKRAPVIGSSKVDAPADRKRFHVTEGGVTVIVPESLGQQVRHLR